MSKTATRTTNRSLGVWQGMNWIRPVKRLAIYLRDGLACAWCGQGVENGIIFSLDHLKPHAKGGSNHEANLVTCCKRCNDSRGARGQKLFAGAVAGYLDHGIKAEDILGHIRQTSRRSLAPFLQQAEDMMARRGTVSRVLAHIAKAAK